MNKKDINKKDINKKRTINIFFEKKIILASILSTSIFSISATSQAVEIEFFRFFGDCNNEYGNSTDVANAVGECGIIQTLTNKFNVENELGIKVNTQTANWGTYYELLSATYTTNKIPDIAVMHRTILPNYVEKNLVIPIQEGLTQAGVNFADFVPAALTGVTVNDTVYAMPWDMHATVLHINLDLMKQAGLVNQAGEPIIPTNPEELMAQGKQFKEATGKEYFVFDPLGFNSTWYFYSMLFQQGAEVFDAESGKVSLNTPEAIKAATLLNDMFKNGFNKTTFTNGAEQQAFLQGDAGISLDGTWWVQSYAEQAKSGKHGLKNYRVSVVPQLFDKRAAYSDGHIWVIPTNSERSTEKAEAAMVFLKYLNDHNIDWARTGHLPVRQTVFDDPEFQSQPHRSEYAETAQIARSIPNAQNQKAILDTINNHLSSIWLENKTPEEVLAETQSLVERMVKRNSRKRG